jgi:enamine deaminase RidA (YjgF/YER057c/UK114 family)
MGLNRPCDRRKEVPLPLERINPEGLAPPGNYSHVVVADAGTLVFVAGQVALDTDGNLVGSGDVVAQARQAFRNVAIGLAAAGASPDDVAKLMIYVVGYSAESMEGIRSARREVFGDTLPASTFLGVQSLARREFLIEVDAVAAIDRSGAES